jgi:hypothetical protein
VEKEEDRKPLAIVHRKTVKPFTRIFLFPDQLVPRLRADLELLQSLYKL